MNLEKELETVQRFIHNERPSSDVTTALDRIEETLREQGEVPDAFVDLDQAVLDIIENGHSYNREETAQAALDTVKFKVLD